MKANTNEPRNLHALHEEAPRIHAAIDAAINNVLHLFGYPLTLQVGGNGNKITIENVDVLSNPETIRMFLKADAIRIHCGAASAGLAAVVFKSVLQAQSFLDLNPLLSQTLITECDQRVTIWLRISGDECSVDQTLKTCTWVSSQSISVLVAKAESFFLGFKPIVQIRFSDLRWDDSDRGVWQEVDCQRKYGPPILGGKGNVDFWAAFFVVSTKLSYSNQSGLFCECQSNTPLSSGQVARMLIEFVQKLSGDKLEVLRILQGATFSRLMTTTKVLALSADVGEEFGIERFIALHYEKQEGESITISEILRDYEVYLRAEGILRASQKVNCSVRSTVLACFGLTVSKSIDRGGRQQNGFRGLKRRSGQDECIVPSL